MVSKFASCPVAATGIAEAKFILTITDAEKIAVAVKVAGELRVTRVLLLAVVIGNVSSLVIGEKVSGIILEDETIKVYLSL